MARSNPSQLSIVNAMRDKEAVLEDVPEDPAYNADYVQSQALRVQAELLADIRDLLALMAVKKP